MKVLVALREGRVANPDSLSAFVHGTAKNLLMDRFRSNHRKTHAVLPPQPEEAGTPEEHILDLERRKDLGKAITALKPDDRQILLLTLQEGLKPAEVAKRLGLEPDTVRQRKLRALRRIRDILRDLS